MLFANVGVEYFISSLINLERASHTKCSQSLLPIYDNPCGMLVMAQHDTPEKMFSVGSYD